MTTQLLPCDHSCHDTFRNELFASWNTTLTLQKEMIEAEEQVASGAASPERLTLLVIRLNEELKRNAELKKKAQEIERTVDPLLSMVANTLLPPLLESIQTDPAQAFSMILTHEIDEAEKLAESAMAVLRLYQTHHKMADLQAGREALGLLEKKTTLIKGLPGRCGLDFCFREKLLVERIDCVIIRISLQIKEPSPHDAAELLRTIDRGIEEGMPSEEEKKKAFLATLDAGISRLPASWQNKLDGWVYHFSPSPKGGVNWGRLHRFDRLEVLQGALITTMREEIAQLLATQYRISSTDECARFYRALHSMAGGPITSDPVRWSEEQLPYLLSLIDQTADALKNPEQFIELYHVDETDPDLIGIINRADNEELRKVKELDRELRKMYTFAQLSQKTPNQEEIDRLLDQNLTAETKTKLTQVLTKLGDPPQKCNVSWGSVDCASGLRHLLTGIRHLKLILATERK